MALSPVCSKAIGDLFVVKSLFAVAPIVCIAFVIDPCSIISFLISSLVLQSSC